MVSNFEIRLGNVLLFKGDTEKLVTVTSISEDLFVCKDSSGRKYESDNMDYEIWPVELDPSTAIEIGFVKIKEPGMYEMKWQEKGLGGKQTIRVVFNESDGSFGYLDVSLAAADGFKQDFHFQAGIPTLHALQNAFYALVGQNFQLPRL